MKRPSYIGRISPGYTAKIHRKNKGVAHALAFTGLEQAEIDRRIQTDLKDVYQRKSLACAYEQARVQHLIPPVLLNALNEMENLHFVTVGRSQDRVTVGYLWGYSFNSIIRHYKRGVAHLTDMGVANLKVFLVLEVHLVEALDGTLYWELHYHAIVQGATAGQLKEAFKVRNRAALTWRRRPLHVQPITDLDGAIRYCLKLRPKKQVQYRLDSGLRWRENRLPTEHLPEWNLFMSRFAPSGLFKFVGINADALNKALTCELRLDLSEISHGQL
jgi:hypothetical protein